MKKCKFIPQEKLRHMYKEPKLQQKLNKSYDQTSIDTIKLTK